MIVHAAASRTTPSLPFAIAAHIRGSRRRAPQEHLGRRRDRPANRVRTVAVTLNRVRKGPETGTELTWFDGCATLLTRFQAPVVSPGMFERLHPDRARLSAEEIASELRGARPRLFLNMVATLDGRTTLGGRSGPIGGEGDRELFHALRTVPDAILAGTGTVGAERYGRMVRDPQRRALREAAGLAGDPVAVMISRRGRFPFEAPLFEAPEQQVILYSGVAVQAPSGRVEVVVMDDPRPRAVLDDLAARGIGSTLCEGGPRLNHALLEDGVVDDLFLTLGALVAGGDAERAIVEGPALGAPAAARLVWVLRHGDELLLRYGL